MSVQKRTTKAGKTRWVARYRDHGKREHSRSFDTQKAAKAWLTEQQRALQRGEWVDPASVSVTVGDLVAEWSKSAVRENTVGGRRMLENNLGDLDRMPVVAVRRSHVQAWANVLRDGRPWAGGKPLAASSIVTMKKRLSTVMAQAELDGLIARNPVKGVEIVRPSLSVEQEDIPSTRQVAAMRDVASEAFKPLILFAAGTGMRSSEVAGLRVSDVDFLRQRISVVQQLDSKGDPVALKTSSSRRSIPVGLEVIGAVNAGIALSGAAGDDLVFRRASGAPWTRATIAYEMDKVGQGFTFHDLRHFYASGLIAAGVDVKGVQVALGHASASVTLDTYTHLWPTTDERVRVAASGLVRDICGIEEDVAAEGVE